MSDHRPSQRLVPRPQPDRSVPSLFDLPPDDSIEGRFEAFHAAHPEVYAELVRLAREYRAACAGRLGIGMLWEVLRWQTAVGSTTGSYRLNNVFRSHYARRIMATEADLVGIFDTRELRSR